MQQLLDRVLAAARQLGASDVHLKAGVPPIYRIKGLLETPQRTREIRDAIAQSHEPYGMVSFNQSLIDLVQRRLVTYDEAHRHATNPDDFALAFRGVSGGMTGDEWHNKQVLLHNVGPSSARPPSTPSQATPHEPSEFEIQRFTKE